MGLKQQMKQTLGMTMTPQLQQAIKILQMSVLELQTEVTAALVDNPTLEEDHERSEEDNSVSNMGAAGEGEDRSQDAPNSSTDSDRITDAKEDFDWENYL